MAKPGRNEIAVGVLLLAAMALLGWMALKVGALRRVAEEVHVSAHFADVTGLPEGAAVQVAGVPVGRVTDLRVDGKKALVTLALREDAAMRKDVVARIRARSVLGEKYVELSPQSETEALLKDGDELQVGLEPLEIDELVTSMGPMLAAVDPQAVADLVNALSEAVKQDPERLNRMLADTETLLHNAALASADAPALVSEARAAVSEVRRATADARPVAPGRRNYLARGPGAAPGRDRQRRPAADGRRASGPAHRQPRRGVRRARHAEQDGRQRGPATSGA